MVSQPIVILFSSALHIRSFFILSYLLSYILLDISAILLNLNSFKLKKVEVVLILILFITIPVGLINNPIISRRLVTDFLVPFIFILKIALIRHFLSKKKIYQFFTEVFISRFIWWNFFSAVFTLILFYIIRTIYPMYLGLTPQIYPLLIYSILSSSNLFIAISLMIIFFSGKRSMLFGAIIIILTGQLRNLKNRLRFIQFFFLIVVTVYFMFHYFEINKTTAFNKYKWTYEKLSENMYDPDVLDLVTGGRVGEFNSILKNMEPFDYVFGKGIGFTYKLESFGYKNEENHSNAHFTPLSIISKYGLIFYIVIMGYVIKTLIKSRKGKNKKDPLNLFCFLFIIGINIDFLFAYGFFTNKFFPFAIGYINRKKLK